MTIRTVNKFSWVLYAALLLIICSLVSIFTVQWANKNVKPDVEAPMGHEWLHRELSLTEEEAENIEAFEPAYQEKRQVLMSTFDQRIQNLANLLVTQDQMSPEVTHAIHELHVVHGELQQLAITHYFQMIQVLPPEKQKMLQELAVQGLSEPE